MSGGYYRSILLHFFDIRYDLYRRFYVLYNIFYTILLMYKHYHIRYFLTNINTTYFSFPPIE